MINFYLNQIPSLDCLRNTVVFNRYTPACFYELIFLLYLMICFQDLGVPPPDWMKIGDYNGTDTIKVYKLFLR